MAIITNTSVRPGCPQHQLSLRALLDIQTVLTPTLSRAFERVRAMPNTGDTIKRLVQRAAECRALAGIVADQEAAADYLNMADAYELLAEQERTLLRARQGGCDPE